jgi:hypothetical protein
MHNGGCVEVLNAHDFGGTAQQEDSQDGSQSAHFIGEGSNLASEATPEAVK